MKHMKLQSKLGVFGTATLYGAVPPPPQGVSIDYVMD
jgi:hypothetical protein